jgi:hypothetical protein
MKWCNEMNHAVVIAIALGMVFVVLRSTLTNPRKAMEGAMSAYRCQFCSCFQPKLSALLISMRADDELESKLLLVGEPYVDSS